MQKGESEDGYCLTLPDISFSTRHVPISCTKGYKPIWKENGLSLFLSVLQYLQDAGGKNHKGEVTYGIFEAKEVRGLKLSLFASNIYIVESVFFKPTN